MARKQSKAVVTQMAIEVCGDTTDSCIEVRDNMIDIIQAELGAVDVTRKAWDEGPNGQARLRCQVTPVRASKGKGKKHG